MSRRIAMIVRLMPEHRETYLHMHRNPDPRVLEALSRAHHTDYRIFLHGEVLVATYDYDGVDLEADRAALRADPALQEWMAKTAACQQKFYPTPNGPLWTMMDEIFHNA